MLIMEIQDGLDKLTQPYHSSTKVSREYSLARELMGYIKYIRYSIRERYLWERWTDGLSLDFTGSKYSTLATFCLNNLTNFSTKEEYLLWVAQWKESYNRLVEIQKDTKRLSKIHVPVKVYKDDYTGRDVWADKAQTYRYFVVNTIRPLLLTLLIVRRYAKIKSIKLRREAINDKTISGSRSITSE